MQEEDKLAYYTSADYWYQQALLKKEAGEAGLELECLIESMRRINRFGPAFQKVKEISGDLFMQAKCLESKGDTDKAVKLLVRALELNPDDEQIKLALESIPTQSTSYDYTRHCFIDRKADRARNARQECFLRCIEFLTTSGIVGDVLEFGVLMGWSARILAETMRNEMFFGDLHLFDSFAGLPKIVSKVDVESFEIRGRNLWRDNMKFSDEFVDQLGIPIENYIRTALSRILSEGRIKIHKGFYEYSLKENLNLKAALVHIDCDLYQSTIEVLEGLARLSAFQDGTVIIFDDWNCNKANPNFGERRAFKEFLENHSEVFQVSLFFTYGHNGSVFILHRRMGII